MVAALYFFSGGQIHGQEDISLQRCIDSAVALSFHERSVQILREDVTSQNQLLKKSFLPSAQLAGRMSWQSDVTNVPISLPNLEVPSPAQAQIFANVELRQLIYDGGSLAARSAINDEQFKLRLLHSENSLSLLRSKVISLFYQVAMQDHLLTIYSTQLTQMQHHLEQIESLLSSGLASKRASVEVKLGITSIQQKIKESNAMRNTAMQSLKWLCGIEDVANVDWKVGGQTNVENVDLEDHIQMQLLDQQSNVLDRKLLVTASKYRPRFSAFATLGYGRPGLNFLSDQFDAYAMVGISMTVPLDHFYSSKRSVDRQIVQYEKSLNIIRQEETWRWLNMEDENHRIMTKNYRSWIEEDMSMIRNYEAMVELSAYLFEHGEISHSEYLEDITKLNVAQERKAIHEVQLQMQSSLYLNFLGRY